MLHKIIGIVLPLQHQARVSDYGLQNPVNCLLSGDLLQFGKSKSCGYKVAEDFVNATKMQLQLIKLISIGLQADLAKINFPDTMDGEKIRILTRRKFMETFQTEFEKRQLTNELIIAFEQLDPSDLWLLVKFSKSSEMLDQREYEESLMGMYGRASLNDDGAYKEFKQNLSDHMKKLLLPYCEGNIEKAERVAKHYIHILYNPDGLPQISDLHDEILEQMESSEWFQSIDDELHGTKPLA